MKIITKTLLIISLIFCSLFFVNAYAQVTCTANAPQQIAVGQPFNFTISLNQQASQIASVQFPDFNVVGGPSTGSSSSITVVNGQMTQTSTYTYTYTLSAQKEGTFTVPPVTMKVNDKLVKSNAVTIKVVAAQQSAQTQGKQQNTQQATANFDKNDVFVRASASKSNPYQGEQVIVTHKLYVGPSVNGGYRVENINIPTQAGLWSYTLGNPQADAPKSAETVNGKKYTVYEIRRTAVFPQKSGEITVTPMEVKFLARVITKESSGDPFFDHFFGGGQSARDYSLDLKSDNIKLSVKPLPEANKPINFSGLAGNFSIKALLSRNQLKANDATNLTITISGTGNIQHVDNLNIEFPPDFDVTDPKITDNINTHGSSVTGSRIFEYVIIPRNQGTFTINPVTFSYFDLSLQSYKTIKTEEFTLQVDKGSGDIAVTSSSYQKEIKILGNDIRFIKTSNAGLRLRQSSFFGTPAYITLLLLPLLLLFLFIIIWRNRIEYRSNVALVKNRKAKKVAKKRLKKAQILLKTNNETQFYIEISGALWGYLSDKYHIPLSTLSMESVEIKLTEKKIDKETVHDFLTTLEQCEFARFAPGDSSQLMAEMYNKALTFIYRNEEKNIKSTNLKK